jgi:hypothetical protein
MSDTPSKPGPKPQGFKPFPAQLWPDQVKAIRAEGETRGYNQGNAVLRDIIDFWGAHRSLFFAWVASRGNSPREPLL